MTNLPFKIFWAFCVTMTCSYSCLLGKTVHWTGEGDGIHWSDLNNWSAKINEGDQLAFTKNPCYVYNNLPSNFKIEGLYFERGGWIVHGNGIQLGKGGLEYHSPKLHDKCSLALDLLLVHKNTPFVSKGHMRPFVLSGTISGPGGILCSGGRSSFRFANEHNHFQGPFIIAHSDDLSLIHLSNVGQASSLGVGNEIVFKNPDPRLASRVIYNGLRGFETDKTFFVSHSPVTFINHAIMNESLTFSGLIYMDTSLKLSGTRSFSIKGDIKNGSSSVLTINMSKSESDQVELHQPLSFLGKIAIEQGELRLKNRAKFDHCKSVRLCPAPDKKGRINHPVLNLSEIPKKPYEFLKHQTLEGIGNIIGSISIKGTLIPGYLKTDKLEKWAFLVFQDNLTLFGKTIIHLSNTNSNVRINVKGELRCGGILSISIGEDIQALKGKTITILQAHSILGKFKDIQVIPPTSSLSLDPSRLYTDGAIRFF